MVLQERAAKSWSFFLQWYALQIALHQFSFTETIPRLKASQNDSFECLSNAINMLSKIHINSIQRKTERKDKRIQCLKSLVLGCSGFSSCVICLDWMNELSPGEKCCLLQTYGNLEPLVISSRKFSSFRKDEMVPLVELLTVLKRLNHFVFAVSTKGRRFSRERRKKSISGIGPGTFSQSLILLFCLLDLRFVSPLRLVISYSYTYWVVLIFHLTFYYFAPSSNHLITSIIQIFNN